MTMLKQHGSANLETKPTERRSEDVDYSPITNRIIKVQKEEYLIKNACYSQAKYYLCKQNNKRSLLGRKQQSQVARSFPNRYLFSYANKVTSLFSISCILDIILPCKCSPFANPKDPNGKSERLFRPFKTVFPICLEISRECVFVEIIRRCPAFCRDIFHQYASPG